MKAGKIFFAFFLLASSLPQAHASFETDGYSARAIGMGEAFSPLSDDLSAVQYNPAGLVYLKRKEIATSVGLLHTGLEDNSSINASRFAYGHPLSERLGTLALSWDRLSAGDLYGERTITLGYGRKLFWRWSAGFAIKELNRSFDEPQGATSDSGVTDRSRRDPLFAASGNSRSNFGADFGLLFRPDLFWSFGLSAQNINEPNLAVSDTGRDPVPMTVRGGAAFARENTTWTAELRSRRSPGFSNQDLSIAAGVEKWLFPSGSGVPRFALRGSAACGSRVSRRMTMGLALRSDRLQLDYAFAVPLTNLSFGSTSGSHWISLSLKFGKLESEPDEETRIRAAQIAARKAEEELKAAREESDRMLQELNRLKTETARQKEEAENNRRKMDRESGEREVMEQLNEEMGRYWTRKSAGASVDQCIDSLREIIQTYSGMGANVSSVQKELDKLVAGRTEAEINLAVNWNYYLKITKMGTNLTERISLLRQMVIRFSKAGADMRRVEEELERLRGE